MRTSPERARAAGQPPSLFFNHAKYERPGFNRQSDREHAAKYLQHFDLLGLLRYFLG
jgi:hypothetical protein